MRGIIWKVQGIDYSQPDEPFITMGYVRCDTESESRCLTFIRNNLPHLLKRLYGMGICLTVDRYLDFDMCLDKK